MKLGSEKWPNLFVVGAAKAGTTSIHGVLGRHPDIFMSEVKEPHYFADIVDDPTQSFLMTPVKDRRAYLALFADGYDQPWRGESSPSYLWDSRSAQRISNAVPEPYAVIMLRDPIERAYSHYLMDVREGIQRLNFYDALIADRPTQPKTWGGAHLYAELGYYAEAVGQFMDVFGRERVFIGIFERFVENPMNVLEPLFRWLGVKSHYGFTRDADHAHANRFAVPRGAVASRVLRSPNTRRMSHLLPRFLRTIGRTVLLRRPSVKPPIDPRAVELLTPRYVEERAQLERLLGDTLPWQLGRTDLSR